MQKGTKKMITSAWKFGKDIEEITEIRASVNDTWDSFDEKSIHLIIYNEGSPVGCGSVYFDSGSYHIAHMAVKPKMQRQYIGDLMIRLLIVKSFNMMAEKITIISPINTKDFFKKYGFKTVEVNEESEIMEVTPQTLIMNSKCGHDCTNCVNKNSCTSK